MNNTPDQRKKVLITGASEGLGLAISKKLSAEILSIPGNLLLLYPQENLESSHIRNILFKEIVAKVKGDCQLIWSSNILEYFESLKPSVYFNMLDCGTNHDFNFEALKENVNKHHQNSFKNNIRFTVESNK